MKKFAISIIAVLLSGCTALYFTQPLPQQTESLKTFPESWWGTYRNKEDTLIIQQSAFEWKGKLINLRGSLEEKEKFVLKPYKEIYLFNYRDSLYWLLCPVKFANNKIKIHLISIPASSDSKTAEEKIATLRQFAKVKKWGNDYVVEEISDEAIENLLKDEDLMGEGIVFRRLK